MLLKAKNSMETEIKLLAYQYRNKEEFQIKIISKLVTLNILAVAYKRYGC